MSKLIIAFCLGISTGAIAVGLTTPPPEPPDPLDCVDKASCDGPWRQYEPGDERIVREPPSPLAARPLVTM